jgi:hypothetical protein
LVQHEFEVAPLGRCQCGTDPGGHVAKALHHFHVRLGACRLLPQLSLANEELVQFLQIRGDLTLLISRQF